MALELLPKALTMLQVWAVHPLAVLRLLPRSIARAASGSLGLHHGRSEQARSMQPEAHAKHAGFSVLPSPPLAVQMAGGGEADQVGSSACTGIINRVCQYSWPLGSIGKVLAVLRDFPL